MAECYDIAIVGGGLVGLALARALKGRNHRIVLLEQQALDSAKIELSQDRPLTLSPSSHYALNKLDLWPLLEKHITPIQTIHVSRQSLPMHTIFKAKDFKQEALGWVIPAGLLQQTLQHAVTEQANITLLPKCAIQAVTVTTDGAELRFKSPQGIKTLRASLIVAADGSNSSVRTLLNLSCKKHDHQHYALVGTVHLKRAHQQVAYERFLKHGILALLPYQERQMGLVWCMMKSEWQQVETWDEATQLKWLQTTLGYRLGRLLAVKTLKAWPLTTIHAETCIGPRTVLIGHAAHTLYPVAAQGFNLGLRDVLVLAEELRTWDQTCHVTGLLDRYQRLREPDHREIRHFISSLLWLYGRPFPLQWLLQLGSMALFDQVPYCKKRLTWRAMGLDHMPMSIL